MTYRFGPFVADRTAYRVSRGEVPLELTPKLLDVLFYLLDRPATLVTKEELLDEVWPGANVTDNALAQAMSDLRDALGDSPATPTYIRTVARRGYRFVAPIETSRDERARIAPPSAATSPAPLPPGGLAAVAVLDFANVTDDPDIAWLRAGIAETVTSDLGRLDHFRVDRSLARRAGRAAHRRVDARDGRGARRVAPRHGQLSARRPAAAHHGAARRSHERRGDRRREGRRPARRRLHAAGRDRRGVRARFGRARHRPHDAAGRARDVQPRGLPRLHRGLAQDREPRHRSGPGRHRRLRRARSRATRAMRSPTPGSRARSSSPTR